ncbi:MAG: hypothetical protein QOG98_3690, partial [Pseudonocardiales bacterium]|nr:hypothetical protein [Pseudonocardiales bacterium]
MNAVDLYLCRCPTGEDALAMTLDRLEADDTLKTASQGCPCGHPGAPSVRRKQQAPTTAWKLAITPVAVT